MTEKVWFIAGVSGGLGLGLARAALAHGDLVVGTTPDGATPPELAGERLTVLPLEITERNRLAPTVRRAHAAYGRLDVVVTNISWLLLGLIEDSTPEDAKRAFSVNFFGPLDLIRATLPFLRRRKSGQVIIISSVAGLVPIYGAGLYVAASFALEGLSQTLAEEVARFGIWVTLVEPGASLCQHPLPVGRSDLRTIVSATIDAELGLTSAIDEQRSLTDLERGAQGILAAVQADEPPLNLVLGADAIAYAATRMDRFVSNMRRWRSVSLTID